MMKKPVSRSAAFAILAVALSFPAQAHAAGWRETWGAIGTGAKIGVDLAIVRPMGLVAIAVGAGAFVPIAFLTAPNGLDGIREAHDILIDPPVRYVFFRPVGDL